MTITVKDFLDNLPIAQFKGIKSFRHNTFTTNRYRNTLLLMKPDENVRNECKARKLFVSKYISYEYNVED